MSLTMYQASVPVFAQFLRSLSELLDLAEAHAKARDIDPAVLLNARLFPNMFTLTRQVGEAIRHAVVACALLADAEQPAYPAAEPDLAELKARIAGTIKFITGLPQARIDGTENKPVAFTFRNGTQRHFTGQALLLTFSLPQFFFHVTTAYDILRHNGVELVKKDFLGPPAPSPAG